MKWQSHAGRREDQKGSGGVFEPTSESVSEGANADSQPPSSGDAILGVVDQHRFIISDSNHGADLMTCLSEYICVPGSEGHAGHVCLRMAIPDNR